MPSVYTGNCTNNEKCKSKKRRQTDNNKGTLLSFHEKQNGVMWSESDVPMSDRHTKYCITLAVKCFVQENNESRKVETHIFAILRKLFNSTYCSFVVDKI